MDRQLKFWNLAHEYTKQRVIKEGLCCNLLQMIRVMQHKFSFKWMMEIKLNRKREKWKKRRVFMRKALRTRRTNLKLGSLIHHHHK